MMFQQNPNSPTFGEQLIEVDRVPQFSLSNSQGYEFQEIMYSPEAAFVYDPQTFFSAQFDFHSPCGLTQYVQQQAPYRAGVISSVPPQQTSNLKKTKSKKNSSSAKKPSLPKKTVAKWTVKEHGLFLIGLCTYGKGDWKNISKCLIKSKTASQVASHAQKYFARRNSGPKSGKRRPSIHDFEYIYKVIGANTGILEALPMDGDEIFDSMNDYLELPEGKMLENTQKVDNITNDLKLVEAKEVVEPSEIDFLKQQHEEQKKQQESLEKKQQKEEEEEKQQQQIKNEEETLPNSPNSFDDEAQTALIESPVEVVQESPLMHGSSEYYVTQFYEEDLLNQPESPLIGSTAFSIDEKYTFFNNDAGLYSPYQFSGYSMLQDDFIL